MTADFDLVVLGDVNPDLVLRGGDVVPAFAQAERLVEEARLTIGGSGAIMACAAASLGLRVALCGVIGADHFGDWMRERLDAEGIHIRGLHVATERPTGITVVLSTPEDRAMLTMPGTIADLQRGLIDLDLLRAAAHVHVSSYFMQRSLSARPARAVLDRARGRRDHLGRPELGSVGRVERWPQRASPLS